MNAAQFSEKFINPDIIKVIIKELGGWTKFKKNAKHISDYGAENLLGSLTGEPERTLFDNNPEGFLSLCSNYAKSHGYINLADSLRQTMKKDFNKEQIQEAINGHGPALDKVKANVVWMAFNIVANDYLKN